VQAPKPPLAPALIAMTGLQALIAVALFAPGVLAPKLALSDKDIGAFSTAVFAVGVATSFYGGLLASRYGPFTLAVFCALDVALSMTTAALQSLFALIVAGILLGLAFGPETPASSALLSKLARDDQRPLIFSVRQTGNQIGAAIGSIALPLIAAVSPVSGFGLIALMAITAGLVFATLRPRYDPIGRGNGGKLNLKGALALVSAEPSLLRLAIASMPFSAMQMALNTFFVTHAVRGLALSHVTAGMLLALAQTGGLIGRLTWGLVATRIGSSHRVIIGLGWMMSGSALLLAFAQPAWPVPVLAFIALLLGLTASGWNGVFLAEVAKLAPSGRVGEATGAVLAASYTGLLMGPSIVTGLAAVGTLSLSYGGLAVLTGLATLVLIRTPRRSGTGD
jgi:MFS family permease